MAKRTKSIIDGRLAGTPGQWQDALRKVSQLTPREVEVLTFSVDGLSSKEIGEALGVSSRTVEIHRGNMVRKLGAKNTIGAVIKAVYAALAEAGDPADRSPTAVEDARHQERAHIIDLLTCEAQHAASEGSRATQALLVAVIQFLQEEMP